MQVLLLNEEASLKDRIDALEKLKAGCCSLKESVETMITNLEERVRELKASSVKSGN